MLGGVPARVMARSLCHVLLRVGGAAMLLAASPALAGEVTDGPASPGGFYWQKVSSPGKVQYICRSNKEPGIQKNARCQGAKAARP